jgi:tetratricopeptide (TPR) repeat protein
MTQTIDKGSHATVAAANGQAALNRGDTTAASKGFAEAGEILEREMRAAPDEETQHLSSFLAATQYYKGGHYRKARELAGKIKAARLPDNIGKLLPQFVRDVEERAAADYEERIRTRLTDLWRAADYASIIEVLADHPYVLDPGNLAFLRAVCCEALGDYRPAVLFFSDAARWSPNDPATLWRLAPVPLQMSAQGQPDEAWRYAQTQIELFPNAVSYAVASWLCYHKGWLAKGKERARLFADQARYFAQAQEDYANLPDAHRAHPHIREVIGLAYVAAACALGIEGKEVESRAMVEQAIAFDPESPNAWTLRGALLGNSQEAMVAFNKAIELGDKTDLPYYYLADHAATQGDYAAARDIAQEGLGRGEGKNPELRSRLYQLLAISLDNLGAPKGEVEALFRQAIDVAPGFEYAQENYRRFRASAKPVLPPPIPAVVPPMAGGNSFRFNPDGMAHQVETRLQVARG